jgi:hypothetical protein
MEYNYIISSLLLASSDFLLGFLFEPENGGDMFSPEVRLIPKYKVLQPYCSHDTEFHNLYYSPKFPFVI